MSKLVDLRTLPLGDALEIASRMLQDLLESAPLLSVDAGRLSEPAAGPGGGKVRRVPVRTTDPSRRELRKLARDLAWARDEFVAPLQRPLALDEWEAWRAVQRANDPREAGPVALPIIDRGRALYEWWTSTCGVEGWDEPHLRPRPGALRAALAWAQSERARMDASAAIAYAHGRESDASWERMELRARRVEAWARELADLEEAIRMDPATPEPVAESRPACGFCGSPASVCLCDGGFGSAGHYLDGRKWERDIPHLERD